MDMQVNINNGDRFEVELETWTDQGETLCHIENLKAVVFGGIPGERAVIEVLRVKKEYIAAKVVEVLIPSEDRQAIDCQYFGECTGCQYRHLKYTKQLELKKAYLDRTLSENITLHNNVLRDVIPSAVQNHYRNHARFTISKEGMLGFIGKETRRFVHVTKCLLMSDHINKLMEGLQSKAAQTRQLSVRASEFSEGYLIQPKLKDVEIELNTGQSSYYEHIGDQRFKVASPSFFQVNNAQVLKMIETIRGSGMIDKTSRVLDAYAGVGTLAILISPYVEYVFGIEDSAAAVSDAEDNSDGLDNVSFEVGKAEDLISSLEFDFDVAILDPSRKGCNPEALTGLLERSPEKIIYVSCEPKTLSRDVAVLNTKYDITDVIPFDMFPHTYHLESMTFLRLKDE
ncbi:MAG: class I SAM-dependent RNA methyltransferase [Dehalococcoidia bacterium]|tara:strand:+ start:362 stop:1558 length:1197 start_codon:yes stop_codon:yes gene_type:complete